MRTARESYRQQRSRTGRRRGSVLVVAVAGMVAVMGFCALAVDYGFLVADANRLQRACDAAALAGAGQLKKTGSDTADTQAAKDAAVLVGSQNQVTIDPNQITFLEGNTKIRVPATFVQDYFFARVLGFTSGTVTRYAIAANSPLLTTASIAPIGITKGTWEKYAPGGVPLDGYGNAAQLTWVDSKSNGFTDSQFILFDLRSVNNNAKSATHMQWQLEGSEELPVELGQDTGGGVDPQFVDSLDGTSQTSKFNDGLRTRFKLAAGPPWYDIDPKKPSDVLRYIGNNYDEILAGTEPVLQNGQPFKCNPRLMHLIVTNPFTKYSGNSHSPILDLAPVYVQAWQPVKGGSIIWVRFLPKGAFAGERRLGLIE